MGTKLHADPKQKLPIRLCCCFQQNKGQMGISKAAVWCVVAMLACSLLVAPTMGKSIGYGPISKGDRPTCRGNKCLPPPTNNYQRGCMKANNCRSPPGQKFGAKTPSKPKDRQ